MNVLYVTSRPLEINTSASIRNRATIQGLIENGNDVSLLTTIADKKHPSYDDTEMPKYLTVIAIKLTDVRQTIAGKLRNRKFTRIRSILEKILNRYQLYDNFKSVVSHVDAVPILVNFDLIISSSDPKSSHLFVYNILRKRGREFKGKWIQIWGDPFIGDISSQYKSISKIKKEEQKLLASADSVVYVSKLTLETQRKIYPEHKHKMTFIPIPYLSKNIVPLRNLSNVEIVQISYCGDYSSHIRNIAPLYDCINTMNNIHLTVCGWSNLDLSSTDNISILPRQNIKRIKEIEDKADILIHLSNSRGGQIPGKIYQYLGTNKPVLFILDGDKSAIRDIFEKYNRFVFVDNDQCEIKKGLKRIIEANCNTYEPLEEFAPAAIAKSICNSVTREI